MRKIIAGVDEVGRGSLIGPVLDASKKYVMLDHDDLFSKIIKSGENPEKFPIYIKKLVDFCESNNIFLLRTVGVIFSDNENRTTQYIK